MADAARKQRLSRAADFDRVFRHGRSAQHRLLVIYRLERPEDVHGDPSLEDCRVGIVVSKQHGGAVERNKLKRQLREALVAANVLAPGSDMVAIARPGLAGAVEAQGFNWLVELLGATGAKLNPDAAAARKAQAEDAESAAGDAHETAPTQDLPTAEEAEASASEEELAEGTEPQATPS
jgi:ribonuclease P protein component